MNKFFYVVTPGKLLAGPYPGDYDATVALSKLSLLLDQGATTFIDLTIPDEVDWRGNPFESYQEILEEVAQLRGTKARVIRVAIDDMGVPTATTMRKILDHIRQANEAGECVYLHCWGGIGRTGTVVGCYLVEHGATPSDALQAIPKLRTRLDSRKSPETDEQCEFIRAWK